MPKELTQKQYWKLFQKLPNELKDQILSEETAKNILGICERNEVDIEQVSTIADYTGRVLLGILPPTEFQETLEKEAGVEKESAKKVAQEINRFIFYPVKPNLEELYKIEIAPPAGIKAAPSAKERPAAPLKEDVYRETIE